jgi:hypothetical protein
MANEDAAMHAWLEDQMESHYFCCHVNLKEREEVRKCLRDDVADLRRLGVPTKDWTLFACANRSFCFVIIHEIMAAPDIHRAIRFFAFPGHIHLIDGRFVMDALRTWYSKDVIGNGMLRLWASPFGFRI